MGQWSQEPQQLYGIGVTFAEQIANADVKLALTFLDEAAPLAADPKAAAPRRLKLLERLHERRPELRFFVPLATRETREQFESRLYAVGGQELPLEMLFGHARLALQACDAAIVASGTATLEAALLGTPEVIVYRISEATWFLGKILLKVRLFGIVNIILGEEVVPELFQDKFTVESVSTVLRRLLDDVWAQSRIRGKYEFLRRQLGTGKVADRVADAVGRALVSSSPQQTSG